MRARDQLLGVATSAGRVATRRGERPTASRWADVSSFVRLELPVNKTPVHDLRQA